MEGPAKLILLFIYSMLTQASATTYPYYPYHPYHPHYTYTTPSSTTYGPSAKTCGDTSDFYAWETTFTNPNYPASETTALGSCGLRVKLISENICQMRFDFDEFTLSQPDNEGTCDLDFLLITGAASKIPVICGDNSGQHMYVDVTPDECYFSFYIDTASIGSKWNIRVTQIGCDSPDRAPPGCLQYFTSTVGTITSFNYNPTPTGGTRQLANQNYGVCISTQPGYCSVTYKQADNAQFSMSADSAAIEPNLSPPAIVGLECTHDYLFVPNGVILSSYDVLPVWTEFSDRFCGLSFPTVTHSVPPFNIYVVSNEGEAMENDIDNGGFKLNYRMNVC